MTKSEAEARGWAFESGGARAAHAATRRAVAVTSDTPLATLLANIAELEGVGDVRGYGLPPDDTTKLERTNEEKLRDRAEKALATLEERAATWSSLTAAQKDSTLLLVVRVVAALIRLIFRRLDAA